MLVRLKTIEAVHHSLFCQRRQRALTVCQSRKLHCFAVWQAHFSQIDTIAKRILLHLYKSALCVCPWKTDPRDIQPVCKRPATHQTNGIWNHHLPHRSRTVEQHVPHNDKRRLPALLRNPRCPVKCPCANVLHTLWNLHLLKHHRVAEHLRPNPPYSRWNPHHTDGAAVADQMFLLQNGKAAQCTLKQPPYHLRNLF